MKRRIPVIILFLVIAAVTIYFVRKERAKPPDNTLRISGNIEAHESVLSFKVQGRIAELPVEEGQWIEAGAVLARLDDSEFKQRVDIDDAAVRVRQSNLALAQAGTRRQEIQAAEQSVADAQAEYEQRQLDLERAKMLLAKDAIPAQDRDRAATALKRAEAALLRAKEHLSEAREGVRHEEIAIAQANVSQAQEAVELSRINLGFTILRAPKAGVVVVRHAEIGEVVSPGTPVVSVADLDNVWLRGYIDETDLGRVKWGQEASVHTDTFPTKTYKGRVSFIASKAEFTPKSVQTQKERVTLVYRIKIDLENAQRELKPGMPADATLQPATQ